MKHPYPRNPILVVDDEPAALDGFEIALHSAGFTNVITCGDSRRVMDILRKTPVDLVLLDLIMPHVPGERLIGRIKEELPGVTVVVVTAVGEIDTVIQCIRDGATDYLLKPVDKAQLKNRVLKALEMRELQAENAILREKLLSRELKFPQHFSPIVTRDAAMLSIFQYCESVAPSSYPILVTGETGTGKELVARAIHRLSNRKGELVGVNIAAYDDALLPDALFGHVKGAFTGAEQSRRGLVEKAAGGTLFLDEIGDLSMPSQIKLLRLLQEREYSPVGADTIKNANTRIIASTNQDLARLRQAGKFRDDLYYRLMSHHVELPPLRRRPGDIQPLLDHFLEEAAREMGKRKPTYHPELLSLLRAYSFPGNVRELKNLVADAVAEHSSRMLSSAVFKKHIERESPAKPSAGVDPSVPSTLEALSFGEDELPTLKEAVVQVSKTLIREAMSRSGGNQTAAAKILGISQQSLSDKVRKLLR